MEPVSTQAGANADATTLTAEDLALLPSLDRDLVETASLFLGAGNPNDVSVVVDGVERDGVSLPPSAIAEIKINSDPYSAEFSRLGRRRIEIRTQQAAKEYHGSVAFFARNSALDARNAFAVERLPFSRENLELSLTGPLWAKRHLGFSLGLEWDNSSRNDPVLAMLPTGLFQSDVRAASRQGEGFAKLDGQFSPTQTFSVRWEYQDFRRLNEGGGLNLPERARDSRGQEWETSFSLTSVLSPKRLNQFHVEWEIERTGVVGRNAAPALIVHGAFSGGGAQVDSSSGRRIWRIQDVVALTSGNHTLRMGAGSRGALTRDIDRDNFAGTFEFSSLEGFAAGRPLFYRRNEGDPTLANTEASYFGFIQDNWKLRPNFSLSSGIRYEAQNALQDYANFAPRLGFAWSPSQKSKTVIRAGFGFFFDRHPSVLYQDPRRFDGTRVQSLIVSNPGYPDPFATGGAFTALPPTIVWLAPDLELPYALASSISLERQLLGETVAVLEYGFERGLHLFRSHNLNAPFPGSGVRPHLLLGNLNQHESSASSREQTLALTWRGRWKLGEFSAQYRYLWAFSDTQGLGGLPVNNFDLRPEWGRADFDQRHRLRFFTTAELPKELRFGMVASLSSGGPFDIVTGSDDNHDTVVNDRPPGIRRNSGQESGFAQVDVRFGREWNLERVVGWKGKLEVGVEAFNVLNRTNLEDFVGNLRSPFFEMATSARAPRQLQLSLRLQF